MNHQAAEHDWTCDFKCINALLRAELDSLPGRAAANPSEDDLNHRDHSSGWTIFMNFPTLLPAEPDSLTDRASVTPLSEDD